MKRAGRLSVALLGAFALATPFEAFSLDPGRRVPDVRASKWYFEASRNAPSGVPGDAIPAEKKLDVLMIFDADAPGAFAFLRMLEAIRDNEPARFKSLRAVARNSSDELDEFFAKNGEVSFPVAADSESGATVRAWCDAETMLPMAFVSYPDGTLAWSGNPTGVENVMKKIAEGDFNMSAQRQISALRTELQTAIQSGLPVVIAKNADRILALDPGDMIAVQAKLYAFESQGKNKEAREYLVSACEKSPKDYELRLILLSFLVRAGDVEAYKAETLKTFNDFKTNRNFMARFSAFVMDNSPFGTMPLKLAWEATKLYSDGLSQNASKEARASANELLARSSYCNCRAADAVNYQTKAAELRKGGPYEAPSLKLLEFYKQAQEASK